MDFYSVWVLSGLRGRKHEAIQWSLTKTARFRLGRRLGDNRRKTALRHRQFAWILGSVWVWSGSHGRPLRRRVRCGIHDVKQRSASAFAETSEGRQPLYHDQRCGSLAAAREFRNMQWLRLRTLLSLHPPRRRRIHEFASVARQKLVDGTPSRTMTRIKKRGGERSARQARR